MYAGGVSRKGGGRMKLEMTEHDKKLLVFLAVVVLVVCIGYWGIRPQLIAAGNYNELLEEEQEKKKISEMKLSQSAMVQSYNEELETLLEAAKEHYYPMMSSDEADHYITELVLEYDLFIYSLTIDMPSKPAALKPYEHSEKAITGYSKAQETARAAAAPVINDIGEVLFDDGAAETGDAETADIYAAGISLRLSGDEEDAWRLLNDLAACQDKLRLCSYFIDSSADETMLELSLEIYMCGD